MIKDFIKKYKSILSYLFFGALTTIINIAAYMLCYNLLGIKNIPSNIIAFVLSVAFAFVTNKLFVFESRGRGFRETLVEALSFFSCRIGSGLIELIIMYVFVDLLCFNGNIIKVITNVLVIILNYVASKVFIFKKK